MAEGSSSAPLYRFGPFELDPGQGTLSRNGNRIKLQELPYRLLVMLVERHGQIVTREEVRQHLWAENTFVEFDNSLGVAIRKVRESLGDDADAPHYVETIPRRGYRFVAPVHVNGPHITDAAVPRLEKKRPLAAWLSLIAVLLLAGFGGVWLWLSRPGKNLPEHAAVVIGDFANETGDPVFDGSLRRAVVIHLAQSPYLSIIPDQKLGEALQNIGRSPDEALTPALAAQVCQRLKGEALITGSIRGSASRYSLALEAQRCGDGMSLMRQTFSVDNKQQVLARLSSAADDLRRKLGESRQTLQMFDVPMEQATTSSLEALRAYQLGLDLRVHSRNLESRSVLKTAIALDPDFAIAYTQLGSSYSNAGDPTYARQYFQKAFELRARATEPERLQITGRYFDIVTGEREKGSETYKLWTELYPNDWKPYNAIANNAVLLGRYQTAVDFARKAIELGPGQDFGSTNLLVGLLGMNRIAEAKAICEQLLANGHDNSFIHNDLFSIAYLENDQSAMERQLEWAAKHPNDVGMIFSRGTAAASEGRIENATRLFDQTAELDVVNGDAEAAAISLAVSAEINSEFGRFAKARVESERALKLGQNEMVHGLTALVALRAHDFDKAQLLLTQMDHDRPLSTFNLGIYSPIIRTFLAISHGSSAAEVTKLMEPALSYEFGSLADMLPIYARATAYLAVNAPTQAETEFQKIISHRSVDPTSSLYPLSVLGMARCYKMEGKKSQSKEAYQQLFTLWKDADKDLPVLNRARSEFQTLGA